MRYGGFSEDTQKRDDQYLLDNINLIKETRNYIKQRLKKNRYLDYLLSLLDQKLFKLTK